MCDIKTVPVQAEMVFFLFSLQVEILILGLLFTSHF